jgi:ribose transport system permease protein
MSTRAEKQGIITWFRRNWAEHPLFSTAFALVVMILFQTLALGFDFPTFGRWLSTWCQNWINILRNNANIGVIALGMTFVIISGGIELAVGSTLVAIGAVVMVAIDTSGKGWFLSWGLTGVPAYFLAIILGLAVGFVLGELTGLLITKGKIPPFIATLGTMKICRSVTQQFMQGYNPVVPKGFLKIASTEIGGQMVMPIIYWLILAWILNLVAKHTAFGRHVYAVGSNERAAKLSGINVQRVKRLVYMLIGVLVAVSSILQVSRIGAMDYANAEADMKWMPSPPSSSEAPACPRPGHHRRHGPWRVDHCRYEQSPQLVGSPPIPSEAFKGIIVICAVLLQKKEKN